MMAEWPLHGRNRGREEDRRRREERRGGRCTMMNTASTLYNESRACIRRRSNARRRTLPFLWLFLGAFLCCSQSALLSPSGSLQSSRKLLDPGSMHPLWGPKGAIKRGLKSLRWNEREGGGEGRRGGGERSGGEKKPLLLRLQGGRIEQGFDAENQPNVAKEQNARWKEKDEVEENEDDGLWEEEARQEEQEDDGMWEVPSRAAREPKVKLLDGALMEGVRQRRSHVCMHGVQRTLCKVCGRGPTMCVHGSQKELCKGTNICEHMRQRSTCKDCRGSQICEHDRQRALCRACRGSQICHHDRYRNTCKECRGSQICPHDRQRSICKDCRGVRGSQICAHNRQRSMCRECHGSQVCEHGRLRGYCKECKGSQADAEAALAPCEHLIQRAQCPECSPEAPHPLPKIRRSRRTASGSVNSDLDLDPSPGRDLSMDAAQAQAEELAILGEQIKPPPPLRGHLKG